MYENDETPITRNLKHEVPLSTDRFSSSTSSLGKFGPISRMPYLEHQVSYFFKATLPIKPAKIALKIGRSLAFQVVGKEDMAPS